jgi:DnaK suppressor protein
MIRLGKERNVSALDLDTVKEELRKRRERLLETTRRAAAEYQSLRSAERDPEHEEGAQSEYEQFNLARLGEEQRREIQQITAAITRIDAGEYGVCGDCGDDIDPRRLKALPYAVLCADCAGRNATRQPPTL